MPMNSTAHPSRTAARQALAFAAVVVVVVFFAGLAGFFMLLPTVIAFYLWPATVLGFPLKSAFLISLAAWGAIAFAVAFVVQFLRNRSPVRG